MKPGVNFEINGDLLRPNVKTYMSLIILNTDEFLHNDAMLAKELTGCHKLKVPVEKGCK